MPPGWWPRNNDASWMKPDTSNNVRDFDSSWTATSSQHTQMEGDLDIHDSHVTTGSSSGGTGQAIESWTSLRALSFIVRALFSISLLGNTRRWEANPRKWHAAMNHLVGSYCHQRNAFLEIKSCVNELQTKKDVNSHR